MSYNLRPGEILKRPKRYKDKTPDTREDSFAPTSPDTVTSTALPITAPDRLRPASPYISSVSPESSPSPTPKLILRLPLPPNMPNVRNVRRKPQRREGDKDADYKNNRHGANNRPSQVVPPSVDPNKKFAAFPSLPLGESPSKGGTPGVTDLMLAWETGTRKERRACQRCVDAMYALQSFPVGTDEKQMAWYYELSKSFKPDEQDPQISFVSLYPSLRQVIHESIRDAFPEGTYRETFHPVRAILRLYRDELLAILKENSAVWDEIPAHLLELKRLHPYEPVDPETPPVEGIVRAIRFLKQQHLPGSLLGEWQFPVPSPREFDKFRQQGAAAPLPSNGPLEGGPNDTPRNKWPENQDKQSKYKGKAVKREDTPSDSGHNGSNTRLRWCLICNEYSHLVSDLDEHGIPECSHTRANSLQMNKHHRQIDASRSDTTSVHENVPQRDASLQQRIVQRTRYNPSQIAPPLNSAPLIQTANSLVQGTNALPTTSTLSSVGAARDEARGLAETWSGLASSSRGERRGKPVIREQEEQVRHQEGEFLALFGTAHGGRVEVSASLEQVLDEEVAEEKENEERNEGESEATSMGHKRADSGVAVVDGRMRRAEGGRDRQV